MRNYKKIMAATLAMAMVAGNTVLAAAPTDKSYVSDTDFVATTSSDATGVIGGKGEMEGQVSEDVFKVVVPTKVQGTNATNYRGFDFVMDPQKLITLTEGAKYVTGSNVTAKGFVEGKTLYFVNKENEWLDNTSDYVKVTNKSSIDVDITLAAEMKNHTGIALSETETFADDSVSMYMAVIGNGTETPIKANDGAEVKGTIAKAADGAYKVVYDDAGATPGYVYELVRDEEALFSTYEFALTGACNDKADWLDVPSTIAPEVELTWSVDVHQNVDAAPSIATTSYTMASGAEVLVTLDFGEGSLAATGIKSITYKNSSNQDSTLADTYYEIKDNNVLRFRPSYITSLVDGGITSRQFTVTFDDAAATTATITLAVAP